MSVVNKSCSNIRVECIGQEGKKIDEETGGSFFRCSILIWMLDSSDGICCLAWYAPSRKAQTGGARHYYPGKQESALKSFLYMLLGLQTKRGRMGARYNSC